MYINTKDLPQIIKDALASFGFARPHVQLEARDSVHVGGGASKGSRNVLVLVNLAENKIVRTVKGSWGGPNMFVQTIDDVQQAVQLPDNYVLVFGTEGGHGTFANLYANTVTVAPLLPANEGANLTKGQLNALYVFRSIKSSYRRDELRRLGVTRDELGKLVLDGYIVRKGNGVQITLKGKNAAPRDVIY